MVQSNIPFYLILVALLSFAGSLFPLFRKLEKRQLRLGISFGAGVLLSTAFLHMLPEISESLGENVGVPILSGFLVLYILEKFVMVHPCEEGECDYHRIGTVAFVGISFHSILDGIALGASLAFPPLTLAVFLAIMAHKIPEAISLSTILMYDGAYPKERIIKLALWFSLTAPVGAVFSWLVLGEIFTDFFSVVLGFSMGTFLSIAISDLLPQVHGGDWREKGGNIAALFLGIFFIWAGKVAMGH